MKTLKLLTLCLILGLFCSCSNGGQNNGDSGIDDGYDADSGDTNPDEDEEVTRTLVSGTNGFCKTEGSVSFACIEDADCIGIRKPVGLSCVQDTFSVTDLGCVFVAREGLPETDECSADDFCKDVPRECVNNACSASTPDRQCGDDQDCKLEEYGCGCLAMNAQVNDYQPIFGDDCTGRTSCPQGASAACIDSGCHLVGSFMDDTIGNYCEQMSTCGFSVESPDDCTADLTANNYEKAARIWPLIQATSVVTECSGFMNGPWNELLECISQ